MGYVAVRGGKEAIFNAEKLVEYFRLKEKSSLLKVDLIQDQLRLACSKVISEGSLYSPELAALALKQSEGDTVEASFLLRAYRTSLPRICYSKVIDTESMFVLRRISSAFKDIPGGQILGITRDYIPRLLNFSLLEKEEVLREKILSSFEKMKEKKVKKFPKVINFLREEEVLPKPKPKKNIPYDITIKDINFPLPRSGVLQALTRGEEGGLMFIAYSSMRGFGDIHPTLAELRVGFISLHIKHPLTGKEIKIGEILVTEAEVISGKPQEKANLPQFDLGYGLTFGHNERKAISMAILDITLRKENPEHPAEDQEFVIYHIDSIESSGFTNHWKLPHYVTFQSDLDRIRKIQKEKSYGKSK